MMGDDHYVPLPGDEPNERKPNIIQRWFRQLSVNARNLFSKRKNPPRHPKKFMIGTDGQFTTALIDKNNPVN